MSVEPSPGQLYITASGHLYHAGKIAIVMVGMPARGKTTRTVAINRYLSWLGVKVKRFHLSDYRRTSYGHEALLPESYFTASDVSGTRQKLVDHMLDDIWEFYKEGGQVALYDAINATKKERAKLQADFSSREVVCLFIECLVTDERILTRNIAEIHAASPEYAGTDLEEAVSQQVQKLKKTWSYYEPIDEKELIYMKIFDDGLKFIVNQGPLGYLLNRVLLFNMNSRKRFGNIFFARAGETESSASGNPDADDAGLNANGRVHAQALYDCLTSYLSTGQFESPEAKVKLVLEKHHISSLADQETRRSRASSASAPPTPASDINLSVLTSTRTKTVETSEPFERARFPTVHHSLLCMKKVGTIPKDNLESLEQQHKRDPYHFSYPRGESFQDVAVRLEPVLMEIERIRTSVLIIAHESILSVLYGYLMGLPTKDIPALRFPVNQVTEIFASGSGYGSREIPISYS